MKKLILRIDQPRSGNSAIQTIARATVGCLSQQGSRHSGEKTFRFKSTMSITELTRPETGRWPQRLIRAENILQTVCG